MSTPTADSQKKTQLTPPENTGMKVLDKSRFFKILQTLAVKVPPKGIASFMKEASSDLFNQPRLKNVIDLPEEKPNKLILLKMDTKEQELSPITQGLIKKFGLRVFTKDVEVPYEYWAAEDILKSIFPKELPPPSSYTTIGHIAHLNLREQYLPFKNIIGQVILDKSPGIKTVVNKTDIIESTFRNFQMEVLCGEPNFIATVKENDCQFQLDFSKVYWNSRLHTEHERLIQLFEDSQAICDVFAGVGPFALPAAKRGCLVYANDLNPTSYEYLLKNIALNKINVPSRPEKILAFNLDGRDFIRKAFTHLWDKDSGRMFAHVVMNLPATALEFLDGFRGIFKDVITPVSTLKLPRVHVHCFSTCLDDPKSDLCQRASVALGRIISSDQVEVHQVRKVAPKKDMYCLSFDLTWEDLSTPKKPSIDESPTVKKSKHLEQ